MPVRIKAADGLETPERRPFAPGFQSVSLDSLIFAHKQSDSDPFMVGFWLEASVLCAVKMSKVLSFFFVFKLLRIRFSKYNSIR